jgi:hypothetical protein
VPLPAGAITVSPDGRTLTVDAHDVAVIDDPSGMPATVSFQITWTGRRRRQRRGRGGTAPATSPAAFVGRFLRKTTATGSFSGSETGFTFSSDATPVAKSVFAELGTERNGTFLTHGARCRACAARRAGTGDPDPVGGGW